MKFIADLFLGAYLAFSVYAIFGMLRCSYTDGDRGCLACWLLGLRRR